MDEEEIETGENELSDFHRDYLMRYMKYEQRKQERASEIFQKERADELDAQRLKASHNQS
jgi:hypothetical protein